MSSGLKRIKRKTSTVRFVGKIGKIGSLRSRSGSTLNNRPPGSPASPNVGTHNPISERRNSFDSEHSTLSTMSSHIESADFVGVVGEWGEVVIRGGTIDKFIDSLCPEELPETQMASHTQFVNDFLLTYRYVEKPANMFNRLVSRWDKRDHEGRLRIIGCLRKWASRYFLDFYLYRDLLRLFQKFIDEKLVGKYEHAAKPFRDQMSRGIKKMAKYEAQKASLSAETRVSAIARPPLDAALLKWAPAEVARQITLIEFELFESIRPLEFLQQSWSKSDKHIKAPNLTKLIRRTNEMVQWVSTEIVNGETCKKRVSILNYFVLVAEELRKIRNFNAILEIMSALESMAIGRLKYTWMYFKEICPATYKIYLQLKDLVLDDRRYGNLREAMKTAIKPCLPFLGIFLSDLTGVEEGATKSLNNGLLNFAKCRQLASIIWVIESFQNAPYFFKKTIEGDDTRYFLDRLPFVSEKEMYNTSVKREPRSVNRYISFLQEYFPMPGKKADDSVIQQWIDNRTIWETRLPKFAHYGSLKLVLNKKSRNIFRRVSEQNIVLILFTDHIQTFKNHDLMKNIPIEFVRVEDEKTHIEHQHVFKIKSVKLHREHSGSPRSSTDEERPSSPQNASDPSDVKSSFFSSGSSGGKVKTKKFAFTFAAPSARAKQEWMKLIRKYHSLNFSESKNSHSQIGHFRSSSMISGSSVDPLTSSKSRRNPTDIAEISASTSSTKSSDSNSHKVDSSALDDRVRTRSGSSSRITIKSGSPKSATNNNLAETALKNSPRLMNAISTARFVGTTDMDDPPVVPKTPPLLSEDLQDDSEYDSNQENTEESKTDYVDEDEISESSNNSSKS